MRNILLFIGLTLGWALSASAQSFCASDGQATPLSLIERFISADCETCWGSPPTAPPAPGTLTLDWIVPSSQGGEAPLSAAATRDALMRLETLSRAAPITSDLVGHKVRGDPASTLRVAHGVPVGGYIGASIEFKTTPMPADNPSINAWLILVEPVAAGTNGTLMERNLVRNVLWLPWNLRSQLSKEEQNSFHETRPLSIPQGTTPERLRVVGWVEDAHGQVLTAAYSDCAAPE